jgi:hypothetical protein
MPFVRGLEHHAPDAYLEVLATDSSAPAALQDAAVFIFSGMPT